MTTEMLSARLTECGIPHDAELPAKLLRYHELLLDWNTRMDLTAVTDEAEMIDKHYVDSLSALAVPGLIPQTGSLIDVGTGAGFPGLPLALACPGLKVTLMDAQQKRLNFLQAVIDDLGVRNVTLVHARAEDGAQFPNHREKYDLAVARAVASLAVLSEYLLPYVKVGGKVGEPVNVPFPGRDWQHMLLPIQKTAKTARQYPRKAGTPGKSPLGGSDKK